MRARSTSVDEWISYRADVRPHSPKMTLIGEATTIGLETTQNFKCFNCGEQGHLRVNCRETQINPKRESMPSRIGKNVAKAYIGLGTVE